MKIKYLFIIFLLISINSLSQSIYDLDEKNGFKKFIFGESKWQYFFYELKEVLKENVGDKYIVGYKVILDDDEKKVGLNSFETLYIFFYDDELYRIILKLSNDKDLKGIYNALIRKYGAPTQQTFEDKLDLNYYKKTPVKINKNLFRYHWCIWEGNNVRLTISTDLEINSVKKSNNLPFNTYFNNYYEPKENYLHEIKFINIQLENSISEYKIKYKEKKIKNAVDDL